MTTESIPTQEHQSAVPSGSPLPIATELVRTYRWSPTQLVVLALGVIWTALAGIALARAGAVGITGVLSPEVAVALWTRTPILAAIELVLGLVLLVAAAQRLVPKTAYRIIGGVATAFGIVLIGAPEFFQTTIGAGRSSGWLYAAFGVVMLIVGFTSPIIFEREQVSPSV
ncbi:MAG: hypothetical protein HKN07_12095 [Acidimicrobiia bacterium]|nr:hypothetical protein [Acidimicrobiia bacterium]NNF64980.1 hypothetical protein [Acidimicrobiia bacterium]